MISSKVNLISSYIRKDFLIDISYKLYFFGSVLSVFLSIFIFFNLSKLFDGTSNSFLQEYNFDYFSFVLLGIATADLSLVTINSISNQVRNYQLTGLLEEIIKARHSLSFVLFCSYFYPICFGIIRFFLYFLIGILFFGYEVSNNQLIILFPFIILLSILSFIGIGLIGAAFIIVFKKGNPINTLHAGLSGIMGGVLYPIETLPDFLQHISFFLPITHSLEISRKLMHSDKIDLVVVQSEIYILIGLSSLFLLIGIYSCKKAIAISKRNGTLLYY